MVGFNLVLGIAAVAGSYLRFGTFTAWAVVLVIGEALPLWWRRKYPVAVLLVIAGVEIVKWATGLSNEPSGPALVFAVYAVSVYDRTVARLIVAGAAIAIIALAVALLVLGQFPVSRTLIPAGATSLVAWVIGDYMRSRRQFFIDVVARHKQERDQAAEEERLRIARELHDVVAHNVSVMAIQAGAARVSENSSKEALQSIESTARDTLAELNRLLGVLRKQSDDAPLAPQPGLDQVDALIKTAREAGLEASLKVTGQPRPLPAALDLSAYRILQEAITNVLKHAHASRVELTIAYQPDAVLLTVSDNGIGAQQPVGASTGHGLIGLRERVDLFNGELTSGSGSLGGYVVRAKLPTG
ncbi:MAG: sensor histidine kinase [Chloroflexi bacterium]|nr:MAG: sensor histidine kinase [Chloroflexota bacterium]